MQKVHLKRTKRLHDGHLWIFSNEVFEPPKKYLPGSLVEVYDMRNTFHGTGYINPNSLIAIRLLTRNKEVIDRDFFRRRIIDAVRMREVFCRSRDAFRVIYSEGDYLPGLIVDRYGKCIVIQFLTAGMESFKELIVELLDELLSPEIIVIRNDSRVRSLEGCSLYKEIVKGDLSALPVINEDGLLFQVDPYEGQKTGFFLDQRENRICLKKYISGGRGLDLFSYIGAWSMHLASRNADIACVDSSENALARAERNAELNRLSNKVNMIHEDVFFFLERSQAAQENRYDFIVLDPPAFVKSAQKLKEAVRAYRSINEMSMRLLKSGGILATSSCSYHFSREMFIEMLKGAAKSANRSIRLLELRSQGPDHPVLLAMPETEYLKCAFLVVD